MAYRARGANWRCSPRQLADDGAGRLHGDGGCGGLAEELSAHADLNEALVSYVLRRRPRVRWVQDQSRRLGDAFRMPNAQRDATLRARGKEMFYERYAPLIPEP